jgi:uncharacterized RDD family membrane protein YckC
VRYEDRLTIATPEGVEIHLSLAGLGSRFIASLLDALIKAVLIFAVWLVTNGLDVAISSTEERGDLALGAALAFAVIFAINFFYDVLFEVLASGRTPGKRATGLRVVREGGQPVGARASTIRNMLRLIDGLPLAYMAGIIAIVVTKRNQRIGDLAAGTLVVRDRHHVPATTPRATGVPADTTAPAWDVGAITSDEIRAVKSFLERRASIDRQARGRLAWELTARLRPKVGGAPEDMHPEHFLEHLARAKVL